MGRTPLHYAIEHGQLKAFKLFIDKAMDKTPVDKCGDTPLHDAAYNGHLHVYQGIMQHSEHINPGNKLANMPFILLLVMDI